MRVTTLLFTLVLALLSNLVLASDKGFFESAKEFFLGEEVNPLKLQGKEKEIYEKAYNEALPGCQSYNHYTDEQRYTDSYDNISHSPHSKAPWRILTATDEARREATDAVLRYRKEKTADKSSPRRR